MNIELSTANLRKSCRICLHEGDLDLWAHKVKLAACKSLLAVDALEGSKKTGDLLPEEEISVHDILFEMFESTEHSLDEIAAELPLICYRCLADLVPCYRFYRKVRQANDYVRTLYREALKMETELGGEEQVEFLDDAYSEEKQPMTEEVVEQENIDLEEEVLAQENINLEEEVVAQENTYWEETVAEEKPQNCSKIIVISDEMQCTEINLRQKEPEILNKNIEEPENKALSKTATPSKSSAQKRRIIKNPKFISTGGANKILTNSNKSEPQKTVVSAGTASNGPQQKRQRSQRCILQPPLDNASLIVTQFIPSSLQLNSGDLFGGPPTSSSSGIEQSGGDGRRLTSICGGDIQAPAPTNELRTMDYAAVEIMGAHVGDINEEDNIPLSDATSKYATADTNMPHDVVGDEPPSSVTTSQRLVYVCQYCPQAFSASHYLITHVRKSHVCKYCTQAFNKNTELYEHIKQAHRQHKCAICAKIFSSHSNLRSHIKRIHGIQLPAQVALLDYRLPTESVTKTSPPEGTTTVTVEE